MKIQYPPWLKKGDRLAVVAPSGSLRSQTEFLAGVEVWRSHGYQIEITDQCFFSDGYLAGSDRQRRQALREVWLNPQYQGIICVRGGYGSMRILEEWQWENLANPKWLIGFSDITALLWSLLKVGISSIHGPVMTTIASEPQWSQERLFSLLAGGKVAPLVGNGWGKGIATGYLLPGNLTVATHLLHTCVQPPLDSIILAIEEVSEVPYRIDRLLTDWRLCGLLSSIKGIALGRFSRCEVPENLPSWSLTEVLRDRLGDLPIPIVSDLPFGHLGPNAALMVGQKVILDGDQGLLKTVSL